MKKLLLLFLLVGGFASISSTKPQENETIYVEWTHIGESPTHYEVEYRIVKCGGGSNQVHLFLFNESVNEQKAQFSLELVDNNTKQRTTKDISFVMARMKMYKALCDGDSQMDGLRFNLPEGYDPMNTSIKVNFK